MPTYFIRSSTLCSTLLASIAITTWAAEAPPYSVLLQQSLSQAPVLLEQAANVRASSADAKQSHAWLNPTVDAMIENLKAPLSGGVSQRQDTYSITQPIEMPAKRAARIQMEECNLTLAEARERQTHIEFSAKLAVAYATAEAMQNHVELAAEAVKHAHEELKAAQALVQAGKESRQRIAQTQATVSTAQANEQSAIADKIEALEKLSALAGVKEPYSQVTHSLLNHAGYLTLAHSNVDETPAVITATAERDALAAKIQVEEKKPIPDLQLNMGVRRFGSTNDTALVAGISTSIPLFNRNSGAIAAAKERAAAANDRYTATRLEAAATRRAALAQVAASEKKLEAILQGEKAVTESYRLARIGYEAGKTSLLELLMAHKTLFDGAKRSTIEARLARIRAIATLFQADGRIAFGDQ